MNNKRTGLILSYGYTALNMISGLFLSSFLLLKLGDFEYGLYQTVSSFINYLVILEFGTGTVICRNLLIARKSGNKDEIKKVTSTIFYLTVFLSVIISAIAVIFAISIPFVYSKSIPADKIFYAQEIFAVLFGYLIFSFFGQTVTGMFMGNEDYNIGNWIKIIKTIIRLAALIGFITCFKKAIFIAIIDTVISIAVLIYSLYYVKKKYVVSFSFKYFDKKILIDSLPMCIGLLLQTVVNQANSNIGKLVIGIKMTMEDVSLYSVAMYVFNMFSSITTIPILMYLPQISKYVNNGKIEDGMEKPLINSARLNTLVGGTILFGFVAVGQQFINVVYGHKYIEAWICALIVLVPMFLNMMNCCCLNVMNMLNKRHIISYLTALATLINIVLTILLADVWGVIGVAVGTGVGVLLGSVIFINIYYSRVWKIRVFKIYVSALKGILPVLILATLVGGGVGLLIKNQVLSLFVGGVVFIAVEGICLLLFGMNKDEKQTLRKIVGKVLKKVRR